MPFYVQGVLSTDALTSGVRYLALVVPKIVTIMFSGGIVSKYGHYVSLYRTISTGRSDNRL